MILYDVICWTTAFRWPWCFLLIFGVGVGWGGAGYVRWTCTHVRCYAIVLAHMLDATQLYLHTCWMLHNCTCARVSMLRNCTCAHVGCYATVLLVSVDTCSTLRHNASWWGGVGWGCLRSVNLHTCSMLRKCTCAHVGCYAIILAHMLDATQLYLRTCFDATQLYLRTCWMLRNCVACVRGHMLDATPQCIMMGWGWGVYVRWTCTHVRCYPSVLAHMLDATQLYLHTCWMLRNCTCAHVSMLRNCTCAHVGWTRKVAVTKRKRCENMSGAISFRFRENLKITSFA